MADKRSKVIENTTGKFYVDQECIGCHLCAEIAPDNFKITDDGDHDYVFQQPKDEKQLVLCQEAIDLCPVESIGDDGE